MRKTMLVEKLVNNETMNREELTSLALYVLQLRWMKMQVFLDTMRAIKGMSCDQLSSLCRMHFIEGKIVSSEEILQMAA